MLIKGAITKWIDEKGFGFIKSDSGDEIFFHITEIVTDSERPRVNDRVTCLIEKDNKGRLRAKNVMVEGNTVNTAKKIRKGRIYTEPVKKNKFDFIAYIVIVLCLCAGGYSFYQTNSVNTLIPFGLVAIAAFAFLNRLKVPENDVFSCIKCKKIESHSKRTIRAWNTGKVKLYCNNCHREWLQKYGNTNSSRDSMSGGGCLSSLVLFMLATTTISYGFYLVIA